jgi:hypothetical protein
VATFGEIIGDSRELVKSLSPPPKAKQDQAPGKPIKSGVKQKSSKMSLKRKSLSVSKI